MLMPLTPSPSPKEEGSWFWVNQAVQSTVSLLLGGTLLHLAGNSSNNLLNYLARGSR